MRSGELRQRVTLQNLAHSAGTMSDAGSESIASSVTVWAAIETAGDLARRGAERFFAQQSSGVITHRIKIRYMKSFAVTPKTRALFGTRRFDVKEVRNVEERNLELHLLCEERTT